MLDLCYWAKSAFMMDFFYFGQKLKTGVLPRTACADTFEHGDIPWCNSSPIPGGAPNCCRTIAMH